MNEKGQIQTYDHNYAFVKGIAEFQMGGFSLGPVLPERYTPKFAKMIRSLSLDASSAKLREALVKTMSRTLTKNEIKALLFRLDIINEDLNRRGEAAILPQ